MATVAWEGIQVKWGFSPVAAKHRTVGEPEVKVRYVNIKFEFVVEPARAPDEQASPMLLPHRASPYSACARVVRLDALEQLLVRGCLGKTCHQSDA